MSEHDRQPPQPADAGATQEPSEEELRAAYEEELSRITTAEVILQTTVSLLNLGGRRLGLAGPQGGDRDLEQVRDAIDAVRGLMPVLERRMAKDLGPLRDALAQLQMAFAREAGSAAGEGAAAPASGQARPGESRSPSEPQPEGSQPEGSQPEGAQPEGAQPEGPGPAEASGRLWVPGQ